MEIENMNKKQLKLWVASQALGSCWQTEYGRLFEDLMNDKITSIDTKEVMSRVIDDALTLAEMLIEEIDNGN